MNHYKILSARETSAARQILSLASLGVHSESDSLAVRFKRADFLVRRQFPFLFISQRLSDEDMLDTILAVIGREWDSSLPILLIGSNDSPLIPALSDHLRIAAYKVTSLALPAFGNGPLNDEALSQEAELSQDAFISHLSHVYALFKSVEQRIEQYNGCANIIVVGEKFDYAAFRLLYERPDVKTDWTALADDIVATPLRMISASAWIG